MDYREEKKYLWSEIIHEKTKKIEIMRKKKVILKKTTLYHNKTNQMTNPKGNFIFFHFMAQPIAHEIHVKHDTYF